ncbi:MAG TPA: pantoate--beta-alanine ligase [Longimicrobiales bacterium]|nr:pantoate--beta-alanine ligase [Longimicrobiales bacterium]
MKRLTTIGATRAFVAAERRAGARIALVPTMGALHEGHLQLVDLARRHADRVLMSVFVNPLQFGPGEDFARYPRNAEGDSRLARARGVDAVFAPPVEEVYPDGVSGVIISAPGLRDRLCGAFRPGHFEGVLTVVAKLFNIVLPDVAVFGQKDFQQAVLIRRMVRDLDFPLRIEVAPIVREPDGLAMSSRNAYLAGSERTRATALYRGLRAAQDAWRAGERDGPSLELTARSVIDAEGGVDVQYLEVVHPETLEGVSRAEPGSVIAVAAYVGGTRLIDNLILD